MGVPKFYQWISERYPCLSQVVKDHQIPEFDNLYLDMNGIIHPCSHPNDDDPHFRKTEGEIFEDIFHYIEVLFRIIKPKKVFFMAVDGVAPRAKMNQQRGRRFRSAREAEDNIRRALEKGQILPKEDRFDSNCITPGTPFMVRLHEQLKYFVNLKITTDPAWQGIRVYLSGHETPGEGEHKIMEFIRSEKSKPLYDSNTRHCLYGLDADLIMLGLTSHEPHFALLREEVKFGKAAKRISKPEEITFHLLHLTLLREYLDWEFSSLKEQLSFPYDLEKVIDDWILMGFLVGNDFIPHLPHLHINHDSLPYLWKVYKELMPSLDGYLHDGGNLSCPRFEKYMAALSKFDREKFEEVYVDLKWLESKSSMENGVDSGKTKPQADNENQDSSIASENSFSALDATTSRLKQLKLDSRARRLLPGTKAERRKELEKYIKEMGMHDEEDGNTFEIEFHLNKNHYYKEKMGYEVVDGEVFAEQTLEYVKGIQWILHYYFNGVQSWGWFYPFHYAPYMTDIKNFSEMTFDFEMGKPFMPFEQLLAVLPAASRKLLPEPFQNLMIMEQSPIIDYYPVSFETDLNGKQQEWEAVVLIPFIDEKRLLEAMKPLYSRLTEEEKGRNRHSPALLYTYNPELSFFYASTLPDTSDIQCSHASCEEVPREAFHVDIAILKKGLCEGVKLDVYFPGFPTMFHIPHTGQLKKANVKVFMMHSRSNSMMLKITEQPQQPTIMVAKELLGETCYVGWPHMVEALVISICDNTFSYELDRHHPESRHGEKNIKQNILNEKQLDVWNFQRCSLIDTLKERRGIEVGEVNVLVEACPIQGKRYICGQKGQVTLEKQWAAHPVPHALQTIVKDISVFLSESNEKMETIEDLFPVDCQCFMLANPHYGCSGKVLEVDMKQGRVRVQLTVPPEPDIASISKMHHKLSANYLPSFVLAKKLGITEGMLARMTGKLIIERGSSTDAGDGGKDKVDIGLNFKFSKQNKEVLGCARRTENGWTYSPTAVKTISQYLNKFPEMFEALSTINAERIFEDDVLFHDASSDSSKLEDVKDWLKSLPSHGLEAVTCGSTSLDEPVVEAIENAVNEVKASERCTKTVKVRVRPYVLFRIHDHLGNVVPDPDADYQLFDRVVHVKMNATVPFGLRGTIIGIHEGHSESLLYETVFDETFLGGQALRCSSHRVSLVPPSSLINITYGERMEGKRRGTPVQSRIQTRVHASDESPGDSLQWTERKVPFTPDFGTSPVFNHSGNVLRESLDLRFQSPGTPGKGRGFSPSQSPYGGGFGSPRFQTTSWTNVTPQGSQFRVSPNSAFSRSQHSTPVGQIYGTPPSQPGSAHNRGSDRKQNVSPRFQKNADKTPSGSSNSEFANMWKELKSKENSQLESTPVTTGSVILDENQPLVVEEFSSKTNSADPDDEQRKTKELPNTSIQESTKALRELLQIGSKESSVQKKNNASPQIAVPSSTTQSPMREALPAQEGFGRKGESTNFHVSPSPLPTTANGPYPSLILTNWCVATGLYPPSFLYTNSNKGVSAIVQLGNGIRFSGSVCRDRTEACESAAAVALSQMPRVMPHLAGPTGMLPISMFPSGQQFPPPPRLQHMSTHSPQTATFHPRSQAMHGGMTRTPAATRNGPVPRQQQAAMTPNSSDGLSQGREQNNSAQALFVPMQVTRNINSQSPVKSPPTKQLDAEHSGDKTSKEQEKDEYHERERENSTNDKFTELDFSEKTKEISKSRNNQTSRKTWKKPQRRLAPPFLAKNN